MTKYKAIACSFYDLIELYAVKNKVIKIKYLDSYQNQQIIKDSIKDTLTTKEGEFIILSSNDLKIRMDFIISLEDDIASDHNSCTI